MSEDNGINDNEIRRDKELDEEKAALRLWELLRPGLKVNMGRVDTTWGTKTPLGLYRSIVKMMADIQGRG